MNHLLFLLCHKNSMDTITPPLLPRFKFSFQSNAHHFLRNAILLLFVQIQNVPGTHKMIQQKCNHRSYKATQSITYLKQILCTLGVCTVTMVTRHVTIKTLTWLTPRRAQRLVLQSVSALGPTGAHSFTASTGGNKHRHEMWPTVISVKAASGSFILFYVQLS